jgi:hypothetical protein
MAPRRAFRALVGIFSVVAATLLLAACDRAESTPATFDFVPVATAPATVPTTVTTTAPSTSAPSTAAPSTTTTTLATTTTTFRIVSTNNRAAVTTPAPAPTTTTTVAVTPSTVALAGQRWIAVLASLSSANYSRADAAAWRVELAMEDAELLLSDDYSSLSPGYWVLYRGSYPDRATAAGACGAYADRVSGCYPAPLSLAD